MSDDLVAILRSRDLEIAEFRAMQFRVADRIESLQAELATVKAENAPGADEKMLAEFQQELTYWAGSTIAAEWVAAFRKRAALQSEQPKEGG